MLKRTLVTVAGATALAAISFGTPAFAEAPPSPVAACGKGQQLVNLDDAFAAVDKSIYPTLDEQNAIKDLIATVDSNGDGYFCIKSYKPSNGRDRQWGGVNYEVTRFGDN